jgi:hypothetical protein
MSWAVGSQSRPTPPWPATSSGRSSPSGVVGREEYDLFPASIPALAPDGWERAADARHRVTAENRRQRKEFSSHPLRLSQIRSSCGPRRSGPSRSDSSEHFASRSGRRSDSHSIERRPRYTHCRPHGRAIPDQRLSGRAESRAVGKTAGQPRLSARSSTDRASDYGSEGWGFESLRARCISAGQRPFSWQLRK